MRHIHAPQLPASGAARHALQWFCEEAHRLVPDRIGHIIVYGSMARGESGPESDLDLWVDWKGEEPEGRRVLGDLAARIFSETGVLVSVHVVSEPHRQRMREWGTALYRAIEDEGMIVDA